MVQNKENPVWDDPSYMVEYYKERRKKLKSREESHRCPRCGQKAMISEQKQMRSAHKGITYFLVCSCCGKMVRENDF